MKIVLWDTRKLDVSKDFAGGFGVGQYHGLGGIPGKIVRHFYKRDYRPPSLTMAYLGAILRTLGHQVQYIEDSIPAGADLYILQPSLITLALEQETILKIHEQNPQARIWVVGSTAYALPEVFANLPVTLIRGEAEQLRWKFNDVLQAQQQVVDVGSVRDLDSLPFPDWSLFRWKQFRIGYDFWKFPTALIQLSRGCTFSCNYCPYIMVENTTRFRSPTRVAEEMRHGIETYGFQSFKFRDPLFGLDRLRVLELAELIGKLPKKIQFSIEGRIDLLRPETLKILRDVGLTSITVGIETPDEDTLREFKRAPIRDDRQREFVAVCRELGIRTVAGFMIGFPDDTPKDIHGVLRYAKQVNPTFANFNIVTPYPGTDFFKQIQSQIADHDFTHYDVYTPVLEYRNLTMDQVRQLHAKCFTSYYFRWKYLQANASLLWPMLRDLGFGPNEKKVEQTPQQVRTASSKSASLEILERYPQLRKDTSHTPATSPNPAEKAPAKKRP